MCVCTVSYKDDDDGKISRAAFFLLVAKFAAAFFALLSSFRVVPGEEGDQQCAEGVCGRELPVCVRASERA